MRANWSAETEDMLDTSTGDDVATTTRHLKRQKANTAAFFGDSDESEEVEEQEAIKDELMDYFALPQIKYRPVHESYYRPCVVTCYIGGVSRYMCTA